MDQVKDFLRLCVQYRFWISVSVAALFAIVAYFLGSGPVRAKAEEQSKAIKSAADDVKQYASPGVPNDQYKPLVEAKTRVLTKDVNTAWKHLYNRQAPLLTWPETVQERFRKWGRKWPEDVDPGAVQLAIVDYIQAYPEYVENVYRTFDPFDYETGKGVVAAPPKESLLRPAVFDAAQLPSLGKVWSAQERLWIQRTALEVVAQVNRDAKDWDSAIVKQINLLEVGNNLAQDQRSIARGEVLEEAEAITAPGEEEAADAEGGGGMGTTGYGSMMGSMMSQYRGMAGMMGGGMAAQNTESVYYVKPENDKGQYKILPIMMEVLIDQDHIQDLLVEFENSPMSIQVMDIELARPATRVTKPEKGAEMAMGGMMGGMMGYGGMMRGMMMGGKEGGMSGMMGYGGMMSQMMGGYSRMMGGRMGMEMGMSGMAGYGGMGTPARQGTDKRGVDRAKKRDETEKAVEEAKGPSLFDPYYYVVELKVYGQARFFNPPPEEPESELSLGDESPETAIDEEQSSPAAIGGSAEGASASSASEAADTPPQGDSEPSSDGSEGVSDPSAGPSF